MKNFKKIFTGLMATIMLVTGFSVGSVLAVVKDPNEPNDTVEKAVELKPGEIVLGEIGNNDIFVKNGSKEYVDLYKFKNQNERLDKETLILVNGYYCLKDAKEDPIDKDYIGFHMDGDHFDIKADRTGTYYIKMYNCTDQFYELDTTFYTISINGGYKDVKKTSDFGYDPT